MTQFGGQEKYFNIFRAREACLIFNLHFGLLQNQWFSKVSWDNVMQSLIVHSAQVATGGSAGAFSLHKKAIVLSKESQNKNIPGRVGFWSRQSLPERERDVVRRRCRGW